MFASYILITDYHRVQSIVACSRLAPIVDLCPERKNDPR